MAYSILKLPIGYRLYDREKNSIISINFEEYSALERIGVGCPEKEDYQILARLQSLGLCRETSLEQIEHPATNLVQYYTDTHVSQMVLQVTQNCNLRCSYCAYSGSYYNRKHTNKRMSVSTAKRAIDFVMDHSTEVKELTIGFYGGEPLLEFDLIKEIVEYVETQYEGRKVRFNLTTNLTLCSNDVVDYICKKNIAIMISIDGPREIQNKHRKFINGQGSYDKMVANAEKIKEKDPDYFISCMTNTVLSPDVDYESVMKYIDSDALFGPLHSLFSLVNETGLKQQVSYTDQYFRIVKREKFKLYLAMLGEISYEYVSQLFISSQASILQMHRLMGVKGPEGRTKSHPGGPCIPGKNRFFVDTDGNFYPCERIAEFEEYQIGNLDLGFDIEKIQKMINVGKLTEPECLSCWAFAFCGTCIANMSDGPQITRELRLRRCKMERDSIKERMADYEFLKFYGCDFMRMR